MPFCSRRTWKTPSGFTTWPTPRCYDDGVLLPRFQSRYPDRKTAGVYHDNHPNTAADAALPVPVLSRQNPSRWPTFIPAFTLAIDHIGGALLLDYVRGHAQSGDAVDTATAKLRACRVV